MAENKKRPENNGASSLRWIADIVFFISIMGIVWGVIGLLFFDLTGSTFVDILVGSVGGVVTRYVLFALATIAEAASRYLEKSKPNE